jgi:FMN-dependent NADH-azoreductase
MINFFKKRKTLIFILLFINLISFNIARSETPINKLITGDRVTTATAAGYNVKTLDPVELRAIYLKFTLSFFGVAFLILIIYGGFIWMGAQGNEEEVKKAKAIIINAAIGMIVVLASYAISSYIVSSLASSI